VHISSRRDSAVTSASNARTSPRTACPAIYRGAIKLAGDINARSVTDNASLEELLAKIRSELVKLAPIIDLDPIRE
jgi:hypothetical protein